MENAFLFLALLILIQEGTKKNATFFSVLRTYMQGRQELNNEQVPNKAI
jgi:hypothetical protein